LWGALSDERTGLSFVYVAGPCHCSISRVRVPWDSRPYFTVSDLRFPFPSPLTTQCLSCIVVLFASVAAVKCLLSLFPETATVRATENIVLLLLHSCMLQALPSNGRCLQNQPLAVYIRYNIIFNVHVSTGNSEVLRLK
jgi:hypothetical protein